MKKGNRKAELLKLIENCENKTVAVNLVDEMLFLEKQLDDLRKLPFINVNPKQPTMQKATSAAKQYKELLQQYTNVIKIIAHMTGNDNENAESPLRLWVKMRGIE